MGQAASGSVGRGLEAIFDGGSVAGLSDRQLIDRFRMRRDAAGEAAFAAMVRRHGPMVLQVCRRHLGDRHRAEDVFQAVFLVLARKAGAIRDPDRLGAWLHGVAVRTSRKARAHAARGGMGVEGASELASATPTAEEAAIGRERSEAVRDEVERLPEPFRVAVLLCYFEGLTLDEAARRLRWPVGTIRSRLARAREKLRRGLDRRAVAPPAVVVPATVPSDLIESATRAAVRFAAGEAVATPASALAIEVIRSMMLVPLKVAAMAGLGLAAVAIGAGLLGSSRKAPGPLRTGPVAVVAVEAREPLQGPPALPPQAAPAAPAPEAPRPVRAGDHRLSPWGQGVDRAIRDGVRFLLSEQRDDGSWPEVDKDSKIGTTCLVALALLTAGEKPDSPAIWRALEYLRGFGTQQLRSTYAISLQTMVFGATEPERDRLRMLANVDWLERAQLKPGDGIPWPGSWTYREPRAGQHGDNSNTQYALLGLSAAAGVGVRVNPEVWTRSREYWLRAQRPDGGWSYTPDSPVTTASMTCAGLSSLALCGLRRYQGHESIRGESIRNCGEGEFNQNVMRGIVWMTRNFQVRENFPAGKVWKYDYLYGLERAGRLSGVRYFGSHDWFREGADELIADQDPKRGSWRGILLEQDPILATSFALLFLGRGRAPVLIQKLRHAPIDDWNRDPNDVVHLVEVVARDWNVPLDWRVVDSRTATGDDLRRAPILFLNGHRAPEFSPEEKQKLLGYINGGGLLFAEACCGSAEFDHGFRMLMKELFPDGPPTLRLIPEDHRIWRARWRLEPAQHPLWGLWRGDRLGVVYSPTDLSCYWNLADQGAHNPAVVGAMEVGRNVVDHATDRAIPPDKLQSP